jgi:hypothetical protein
VRRKSVDQRLADAAARSERAIGVFRVAAQALEETADQLSQVQLEATAEAQRQAQVAEQARIEAARALDRSSAVRGLIGE